MEEFLLNWATTLKGRILHWNYRKKSWPGGVWYKNDDNSWLQTLKDNYQIILIIRSQINYDSFPKQPKMKEPSLQI
ncbi:unnamed protein product [Blepharisma stoltei]|uniref:Uncharacterized protein n=1 Tax=Blepharisma stoltei TaxID=1481888 RepID=A0AAU9JQ07_9CILI|nr:unnamed protein product [Blepharisma stoltei]